MARKAIRQVRSSGRSPVTLSATKDHRCLGEACYYMASQVPTLRSRVAAEGDWCTSDGQPLTPLCRNGRHISPAGNGLVVVRSGRVVRPDEVREEDDAYEGEIAKF